MHGRPQPGLCRDRLFLDFWASCIFPHQHTGSQMQRFLKIATILRPLHPLHSPGIPVARGWHVRRTCHSRACIWLHLGRRGMSDTHDGSGRACHTWSRLRSSRCMMEDGLDPGADGREPICGTSWSGADYWYEGAFVRSFGSGWDWCGKSILPRVGEIRGAKWLSDWRIFRSLRAV